MNLERYINHVQEEIVAASQVPAAVLYVRSAMETKDRIDEIHNAVMNDLSELLDWGDE